MYYITLALLGWCDKILSPILILISRPKLSVPCFPQFPLDPDVYKYLIEEINIVVEAHRQTFGPLPTAQLDKMDYTGKNAPCCNHTTHCTCSQEQGSVLFSSRTGLFDQFGYPEFKEYFLQN